MGARPVLGRADGARAVHAGRGEPPLARGAPRRHADAALKILFVADVFGAAGRRAVETRLPSLREELGAGFCIVNGENAADGRGLTPKLAERLLASGADVVTLGNHAWARREILPYLSGTDRVIRPANLSRHAPGRSLAVGTAADGTPVAVIQLMGWLFLEVAQGPFELVDELVDEARAQAAVVVLDFHAEATSEKIAMARWLDGRVTAVIGTHTHVQTADARVLPGGTAAISDAGMTGPHDSVIGVRAELAIQRMRTGLPVRFEPAEGDVRIEGLLVECDAAGKALACEAIRVPVD
ncbi:MAG: TIGR00282 family metallophosphoesterase [Gaiellaceae bacterium]